MIVLRCDDDEAVGRLERGGQVALAVGPRVVGAGHLGRLGGQRQRDLMVGQIDQLDVETAVRLGLLGHPGAEDRAAATFPDAGEDDCDT